MILRLIICNEKEAVIVQEKAVAVLQKHPGIPHGIINSQQRSPAVRYFLKNNLFLKGFRIELDDRHLGKRAVVATNPVNILFCAGGHIVNIMLNIPTRGNIAFDGRTIFYINENSLLTAYDTKTHKARPFRNMVACDFCLTDQGLYFINRMDSDCVYLCGKDGVGSLKISNDPALSVICCRIPHGEVVCQLQISKFYSLLWKMPLCMVFCKKQLGITQSGKQNFWKTSRKKFRFGH